MTVQIGRRMSQLTVIVSGMVAAVAGHGGATWAVLQYVLGLRRLGHDVYLVEPLKHRSARDTARSIEYFDRVRKDFGLEDRATLLLNDHGETVGLSLDRLIAVAKNADLLLNISGVLREPRITDLVDTKVYLDVDPAFNHLWHTQGIDVGFDGHTHFATVGLNLGGERCSIPTCGYDWIGTVPPVVLDQWPIAQIIEFDALTSVGNWRSYGPIMHDGIRYGQKVHSLRDYIDLPARTDMKFVLAYDIDAEERDDLALLRSTGWRLVDPAIVADSPQSYREFIQRSKAEIGITKEGYVRSRVGWFSDRSACYLASARPVIAQDTGFADHLPTGAGLFSFSSPETVLEAIDAIKTKYQEHRDAARSIAETRLDSDVVLTKLLERVFDRG